MDITKETVPSYTLQSTNYIRQGYELFKKSPGIMIGLWIGWLIVGVVLSKLGGPGRLLSFLVSPFMVSSYLLAMRQLEQEGRVDVDRLKNVFSFGGQLILLHIVRTIAVIIGFICLILPGIYLSVAYYMAEYEVVFNRRDFWLAMERSRLVLSKKWFEFFGFIILLVLLNLVGLLAFGIGVLITVPISFAAMYLCLVDIQRQVNSPSPATQSLHEQYRF